MSHTSSPDSNPRRGQHRRLTALAMVIGMTSGLLGSEKSIPTLVRFEVRERAGDPSLPCRIHLRDQNNDPVLPDTLPTWNDHFVCDGRVELSLMPGAYTYTIEHGPQFAPAQGQLTVLDTPVVISETLERWLDLSKEGWWSGETHIHRRLDEIELLMRAEDLHIGTLTTWWNNANRWSDAAPPAEPVMQFDENRFVDLMGGEDERGGGALLYFGLRRPLPIAGSRREYPASATFLAMAKQQREAWVEIEKPFWWDTPIWLATGLPDAIGLAHNHLQRDGMLDSEAWGRSRDRTKYPSAWGNGLYTQDLYYHILNTGFRLPPSAGSASGVLPNPVGYNRVWVHLDGELTWKKWWEGLRAGRVFVGNGPLLRVRANGQYPGHVFRSRGPFQVQISAELDSLDPIAKVELVHNGAVQRISLPQQITVQESGWFLVRAITSVTNTFRFASTGPFYVEMAPPTRPVRRPSAQFFLDWTRQREAAVRSAVSDASQQQEALKPILLAEEFWTEKLRASHFYTTVRGEIVDEADGELLPARLYLRNTKGEWFFPQSSASDGSALRYERRNWANTNSIEYHTTLSAHPFEINLPPGEYVVTAERGKEWFPHTQRFTVGTDPVQLQVPLRRWINMAELGWYSGDTHVHRSVDELPNVMLAEDLNVAFPLTYWVTQGFAPPTAGDKNTDPQAGAELVRADDTHVFWTRNTEYELFSLRAKRHTLGAFFVLGHSDPFEVGTPPFGPVFDEAHRQGALLDLDKHDWPWSIALATRGIDLYELANNHHWRTEFGITSWASPTPVPAWMQPPTGGLRGNEADWTRYTFESYYALLNCGFRLRPTAGTANGVHPVPLGFGRVYVHLPSGFGYAQWLRGLNEGRSFVTTGPMLLTTTSSTEIRGSVHSEQPVESVQILINGQVVHTIDLHPTKTPQGAWEGSFRQSLDLQGTSWVAARCFEHRPHGRQRFAHTAPVWFNDVDHPLRPRVEQREFLVQRVRDELRRSASLLPVEATEEYEAALRKLEALETAP